MLCFGHHLGFLLGWKAEAGLTGEIPPDRAWGQWDVSELLWFRMSPGRGVSFLAARCYVARETRVGRSSKSRRPSRKLRACALYEKFFVSNIARLSSCLRLPFCQSQSPGRAVTFLWIFFLFSDSYTYMSHDAIKNACGFQGAQCSRKKKENQGCKIISL